MMQRGDALAGASLLCGASVSGMPGRAHAARRGPQGQNRRRFCPGEEFPARALVSILTALRSRSVPPRPKPCRETKKSPACLGILPSLEAPKVACRSSEPTASPRPCFSRRSRGEFFSGAFRVTSPDHSACETRESLAPAVILRFSFRSQTGGPLCRAADKLCVVATAHPHGCPASPTRLPGASLVNVAAVRQKLEIPFNHAGEAIRRGDAQAKAVLL